MIEEYGPKVLTAQELGKMRAASQAASSAVKVPIKEKVALKSVSRKEAPTSSSAPSPKRTRPTTRSPAPGRRGKTAESIAFPYTPQSSTPQEEEARLAQIREGKRQARL
ncbi:MAG: hypothetical protein ACKPKO_61190, partial [Candidatus Fonsibacter sp.]